MTESFDDIDAAPEPTDDELRRVADLAERVRVLQREVAERTVALQASLADLREIQEHELPQALIACGMSEFKLTDGTRVRIEDKYVGTQIESPAGIGWVKDHGGSPLVRAVMTLALDAGDEALARRLYDMLRAQPEANRYRELTFRQLVPAPTAGKFARERIAAGDDVPLDTLGVYRSVRAKVGRIEPKGVKLTGLVIED